MRRQHTQAIGLILVNGQEDDESYVRKGKQVTATATQELLGRVP